MKRRSCTRFDQPPLKKTPLSLPAPTLQSKITLKLKSLFDGFVSELHDISHDKRPNVSDVFSTQNTVDNSLFDHSANSEDDDATSLVLQNFINSAKLRISGLLNKNLKSTRSAQDCPKPSVKSWRTDPLQVQISLKLQTLLHKTLDKSNLNDKPINTVPGNAITENEWQDLSHLLQNFMSSAKKKLPSSLGKRRKASSNDSPELLSQQSGAALNSRKSRNIPCTPSSNRHGQTPEALKLGSSSIISCQNSSKKSPGKKSMAMAAVPSCTSFNDSDSSNDCLIMDEDSDSEPESISQYLELEVRTDLDNTHFPTVNLDSDEEVVVLGEKHPTYEEITIDEDDNGMIFDSLVQKGLVSETLNDVEELLYKCSQCEKSFRVESLLKFHVRMHGSDTSVLPVPVTSDVTIKIANGVEPSVPTATVTSSDSNQNSASEKSPKKMPNSNRKLMPPRRRGRGNLGRKTRNATSQANFRSNLTAQQREERNEIERIRILQSHLKRR